MAGLQYFKTDGIRGKVGKSPMTPDFLLKLGKAIGIVLGKKKEQKIIIGRDTRVSGLMLQSILEFGVLSTGISTLLVDCIPTPAIAYLTKFFNASAGVVISGSHNLFDDNGIKIFDKNGIKLTKQIEHNIEQHINNVRLYYHAKNFGFSSRIHNPEMQYINFCKKIYPNDFRLSKFTIILDCANGATYQIAPKIFQDLGAKVITLAISPNGININNNSGSTNVAYLKKKVLLEKADIGLALDGDGDRIIMIDHLGHIINGDHIIYIIAQEYLQQKKNIGGVVGTSMTNMGIILGLKKLGIPFYTSEIGDRNIYQTMLKNRCILGAEPSGHIILSDQNSTGDGIIASLQILSIMMNNKKTLYELSRKIKFFPQILINIPCKKEINLDKNTKIQTIISKYKKFLGKKSRILVRQSGTELYVRVMVEGENYSQVSKAAHHIAETIKLL
ncbi:phosphoglucosamine mutase [Buchnera aphidicola (Hyadaphis tataricae)]|uniref:Phosphoglucosamine mutase n=1 Tax=Buchnera aphidicola (Hyadaphis tataricae) TaxID=1241859 RepID=A0A4D6XYS8_9GAMM|nr:phosphoglucosamine mutase [Buchnera aphidicola]QCI21673.1 phosphoglucosamine mutase [Buchnera aphidicola (Hyadaphis tataricae)]